MFESSIRLGTLAGIRIGIHYTWFVIFFLITASLHALFGAHHPEWSAVEMFVAALAAALLFFASIILHELGHSLVALHRGIPVRAITLFIFGGIAQSDRDAESPMTEFLVAVAGPLVSVMLAAIFYLLSALGGLLGEAATEVFSWLALMNFMIAVFNLIPGFPLDGGRIFRALVWGASGDDVTGMRWAVIAGKMVAYGLMIFGAITAATSGHLVNGLWMLGIGWFLLIAAQSSGEAFTLNHFLGTYAVSEFMQHEVPYAEDTLTYQQWIEQFVLAQSLRATLVRRGDEIIGLVTLSDGRKLPREQWLGTSLSEVMTPRGQLKIVAPETPVTRAVEIMASQNLNQLPVVEDGLIVGWINREQLLKSLQLRIELGS